MKFTFFVIKGCDFNKKSVILYVDLIKGNTLRRFNFFILAFACLLGSCEGWQSWFYSSDTKIEIRRYDRVLDEFVSLNSFSALQRMNTEYPKETKLLIEDVLTLGRVDEPRVEQKLRAFYLDSTVQVLMQEVHRQYYDMHDINEQLARAFEVLKAEDPKFQVPCVYTQISALNQSIVVGDSILGISLDKYLGADFPLYKSYYYAYQRRSMCRERLVPDALTFYLLSEYPLSPSQPYTVLDRVLRTAKMHWIVAHILDKKSLDEEIGFSGERAEWCRRNEKAIWRWVKDNHVLGSTEHSVNQMLMRPRENTPALGPQSSDQLGLWIGIRIVDGYMKRHKDVSVGQLLHMTDYQTLWRESGYAL